MARSREEESELNNATHQKTSPFRVASTVYFSLDDGDVLAARPTPPGCSAEHSGADRRDLRDRSAILTLTPPPSGEPLRKSRVSLKIPDQDHSHHEKGSARFSLAQEFRKPS